MNAAMSWVDSFIAKVLMPDGQAHPGRSRGGVNSESESNFSDLEQLDA
jgi:hypothetical protein